MATTQDVINGIMRYADNEVVNHLPTLGKIVVGTGMGIAGRKVDNIAHTLEENSIAKTLEMVDENGNWDTNLVEQELINNAQKYGKISIEIPIVGKMTFSDMDIHRLFQYINREM